MQGQRSWSDLVILSELIKEAFLEEVSLERLAAASN